MNLLDNRNYNNIVFIEMTVEEEVNSIVKFVEVLYKPAVVHVEDNGRGKYNIIFYFDDIDDKYITNPLHPNQELHKANMFKREIRTRIYEFFGIKTTGLSLADHFSPMEYHPITIVVSHTS